MSSDWYCRIGNEEYGPLEAEQFKQLARSGRIDASSLVRKGKDGKWVKATQVWGLFANEDPSPSQSESPVDKPDTSRRSVKGRARVSMPYKSVVAASIVLATIGLAFYLGRQSASPASENRQSSKAALPRSGFVTKAEVADRVTPLTDAKVAIPSSSNRGFIDDAKISESQDALNSSEPAQKNEIDSTGAARDAIATAEKSVALVQVKGITRGHDGAGSGFLVGKGVLVTNYHVIEGAKAVRISFPDGRKVVASGWLAHDTVKDLALIECDSNDLPPLRLAISRPRKLDLVFAIGSPLGGFEGTVSSGIVSGIRTAKELGRDVVMIQTTAPISPGSSVGPLLNVDGDAVGVTCGSLAVGQSLNFAIATEHVLKIVKTASARPKAWRELPEPRNRPAKNFDPNAGWNTE